MAHFHPFGTAAHPRLLLANEFFFFLSYLFLNVTQLIVKWPKAAHFNPGWSLPSKTNQQPESDSNLITGIDNRGWKTRS